MGKLELHTESIKQGPLLLDSELCMMLLLGIRMQAADTEKLTSQTQGQDRAP